MSHSKIKTGTGAAFLLFVSLLAASIPARAQTDPFSILTNSDLPSGCSPQNADHGSVYYAGCCGSPGRRQCVATTVFSLGIIPACINPSPKIALDNYNSTPVCSLPAPGPDPGLGAAFSKLAAATNGPDFTLYVTSDIHFFRATFNLTDQLNHVNTLNNFGNPPWPTGTGIPANTQVNTPVAVVVDGDITTHGYDNDIGAYRTMWEESTIPSSIHFPVLFGLGNHETVNNETSSDAHRMYDYLHARMGPSVHMDPASGNYSWDWQGVHMLQLNTWAGDQTSLYTHASDGLTWLANDLKQYVGNTANPVIVFQHYGTDAITSKNTTGNWPRSNPSAGGLAGKGYEDFWNTIQNYNVVGLFSGHDHCLGATLLYDGAGGTNTGFTFGGLSGYGAPVDDFDDGAGGDTSGKNRDDAAGLGSPCYDKNSAQHGTGNFLTTRVTKNYLDVAAVSWTPENGPYFDSAMGFTSGAPACRKRINSQFPAPTGAFQVTASGNSYTIKNISPYNLSVPVALQFPMSPSVTNYDFVDSCSAPSSGTQHSYILVNGENGMTLGQTITVPVSFNTGGVTPTVVVVTPLSDAVPNSYSGVTSFATSNQPSLTPPNQSFTIHGAANQAYTAAVTYSGTASNWMSVTPSTGTFDQYGFAIIQIQFLKAGLQATAEGHVDGALVVTTTPTKVAVTVPIEITFKAPVNVTLTPSLADWFNPGSANAEFTATVCGATATYPNCSTQSDPSSNDPLAITGIVSLRTQTIDPVTGLVTGTTTLSNENINDTGQFDKCNAKSPADNSVVFGGTGGSGDYCPSNAGSSTTQGWTFDLPPGLYNLAAYYEGVASGSGDSAYAPGVSPTVVYRVGDPLSGIAISAGNTQTAPAGSYFNQLLGIQVFAKTSNNGGPANVPVTFTVIPGIGGASGSFSNGNTTVMAVSNSSGIATAPPIVANGIQGSWSIQATVPQVVSATFKLANGPAAAAPAITTTITNKSGPSNARVWSFQFKNSGSVAAGNVTLQQLTIASSGGSPCTPKIVSGVPSSVPLISSGATGTLNAVIDFSACSAAARFSVTPQVLASGITLTPVVIGNQFQ